MMFSVFWPTVLAYQKDMPVATKNRANNMASPRTDLMAMELRKSFIHPELVLALSGGLDKVQGQKPKTRPRITAMSSQLVRYRCAAGPTR